MLFGATLREFHNMASSISTLSRFTLGDFNYQDLSLARPRIAFMFFWMYVHSCVVVSVWDSYLGRDFSCHSLPMAAAVLSLFAFVFLVLATSQVQHRRLHPYPQHVHRDYQLVLRHCARRDGGGRGVETWDD